MIPFLQGMAAGAGHPHRWVRVGQYLRTERRGDFGVAHIDLSERLNYDRAVLRQAPGTYEPPLTKAQYTKLTARKR